MIKSSHGIETSFHVLFLCFFFGGGVTLLLLFHRVLAKKEPSWAPLCHSAPVLCVDLEYVQGWEINLLSRSKTELGDSVCPSKDSVSYPCPLNEQDRALQAAWHSAKQLFTLGQQPASA